MGRSQVVPRDGAGSGEFGPGADDTGCTVLHVDMDAFYASVEVRRRPELRGKPVIVGGAGPRGVVSAASYEARKFGVRSAMPGSRAQRLCPHAVFLPPDFAAYTEASRAVMAIFRDVTPLVEPLSLDEAFLDVAGARRLLGRPAEIAALIRRRVAEEQRLTCSVGVAPTKFMAKLGSTRAKPDGMVVIPADRVLEYLHPLPVAAVWGVGEKTAETLQRLGLKTVADLAAAPVGMLRAAVGDAAAVHLHELSWGRDPRRVISEHVEKSIGAETTFDVDVSNLSIIRRTMLALSTKVAQRLRHAGHAGRTVSVKIRLADFQTLSRSRTIEVPTDVSREIFEIGWSLFQAARPGERIRLIGVRVEGLVQADGAPRQMTLGERDHGWRDAERAADAVAARFGSGLVKPASLLGGDGLRQDGNGAAPAQERAGESPTRHNGRT
ncbi:DNA polymerase IV [Dactylosporangium sp. AC04546]|uniref:DNA polymerase IV n=1 Tax=Dactylosporangium sp. AC04546 TaxID=2862460 RepID=UPI001EE0F5A5|nr:DNA polymerase IV [Dactylosporangium sp. AC04546]WVK82134.1 DNA polymerase IV [Dactylosporangium sp. AC04546]